jgi:hypothetical protein
MGGRFTLPMTGSVGTKESGTSEGVYYEKPLCRTLCILSHGEQRLRLEQFRTHDCHCDCLWNVVPCLKCGQGECAREDAGNTVKSVQNDREGDGREPRRE